MSGVLVSMTSDPDAALDFISAGSMYDVGSKHDNAQNCVILSKKLKTVGAIALRWQTRRPSGDNNTAFFRNPHYHMPSDLPETLDYVRMSGLVSGLARAICVLAGS